MPSTFHGIEMGKRGLFTHTKALNITGHNISNLNTEGYSRQRVKLETFEPLFVPGYARENTAGQIGQGVISASVERIRSELLDNRVIFENKDLGYHSSKNKYLHQMELIYSEPTLSNDPNMVNTLRNALDDFMSAWDDVANQPDQKAPREVLVERSKVLTNSVNHHFNQFTHLRNNSDMEIQARTDEVNEIAQKIAHLNERILKSEAVGDNPNDLLDKRDLLIDRLSEIVDISIERKDPDELIVYLGGHHLVQGAKHERINMVSQAENDGYYDLFWGSGEKVKLRGGELAGLVDVRDSDLFYEIKKINSFAIHVTDLVNEIHRNGFGVNGKTQNNFFVERPFTTDVTGNFDYNRDGVDESTMIFRMSGGNELDPTDKIGIRGTLNINDVEIEYFETDTLQEVLRKINQSDARVNAFLDQMGHFTLKADYSIDVENPDFVIRHVEDDGLFLSGYANLLNENGEAGAFDWQNVDETQNKLTDQSSWTIAPLEDPAVYMAIEQNIEIDSSYIAASGGIDSDGDGIADVNNGVGDSSIALKISSLKDNKVMVGMSLSFSQFFEANIADLGARSSYSEKGFKHSEVAVQNLENLRQSVSGVNIDEEFTNLIKFQHAYNATAKFITEMDKMLETIIFKLGV